jgi:hypothetical protein
LQSSNFEITQMKNRGQCCDFKNIFTSKIGDFDSNNSYLGRQNGQGIRIHERRHFLLRIGEN